MWIWQEAGVGFVLIVVGTDLAYAWTPSRPAWFWGPRDLVTGDPVPATRVSGKAVFATGVGLVLMSWVGTPAGLGAGIAGVAFLALAAVLHVWAAQMRGAIT